MGKTQIGKKTALAIALILSFSAVMSGTASAFLGLSNTYVRLDRMKTGSASTVRVYYKTSASAAVEDTIKLDFNGTDTTTWTGSTGAVSTTQTVTTAACAIDTGATATPGTLAASGTTSVVTITGVTNLTASTQYCFDLTTAAAVTLPTPSEYHAILTTQTGATVDDRAIVALRVVADDQITVTANVPPTFNFQLDSNTTAFTADLTPGTKRLTTARTFTVNTNAKTGWVAWLRNASTNGLFSVAVAKNIAPTTPGVAVDVDAAPNTEQYVWGISAVTQGTGGGTTSLVSAYDATGPVIDGSGVDSSYRQVASSNGTAANAVVSLTAAATISGVTPAASDYSNVIQVIGAGQF